MKKLKQLSMAVLLTLILAMSALAGEIGMPVAPPPPPDSASATTPGQMETPGEIPIPGATQGPGVASYSATEVALDLLRSVLSVF